MAEYRIDDLARAAGATVRNVRVYQDRGLLPPPRKEGRVGWYGEAHLARLRLISRLLERGFTFSHIGDLLAAWESGRDLAELLGLEQVLTTPWSDEQPTTTTLAELGRLFGRQATPAAVKRAVSLGLLVREGAGFRVPSPRLLAAGADLVAAGLTLTDVLDLAEKLAGDMDTVARRFLDTVRTRLFDSSDGLGLPGAQDVGAVSELIARLRPLAGRAVMASFAAAMERSIGDVLGEAMNAAATEQPARPG